MNFFSKFFKKSSSKEDSKKSESKFLPKKKAVIEERFILKFIENGGEYDDCLATNSSWWRCRSVRYRTGAEFEDARFKEDSF